jgi:hypothetical protein
MVRLNLIDCTTLLEHSETGAAKAGSVALFHRNWHVVPNEHEYLDLRRPRPTASNSSRSNKARSQPKTGQALSEMTDGGNALLSSAYVAASRTASF